MCPFIKLGLVSTQLIPSSDTTWTCPSPSLASSGQCSHTAFLAHKPPLFSQVLLVAEKCELILRPLEGTRMFLIKVVCLVTLAYQEFLFSVLH